MKKNITFIVNSEKVSLEVEPAETLLSALRNRLGIKSPKYGCGQGDCGACNVLLNGKSVRSCLVLAVEVDGMEVITLEGLTKDGLTQLQKSFLKNNSFQCGFCTPGMTISAHELIQKNPHPSEEEIKEALSGNLCRCTGYTPIIDAIKVATCKCKEGENE
ncbi:MAG: (2Fe-2S)-binding protein [Vulcanimicrobiota bacterium]